MRCLPLGALTLCLLLTGCGPGDAPEAVPISGTGGSGGGGSTSGTTGGSVGGVAILSHNAGQDCMSCHRAGGTGKGIFTVAGTVYKNNGTPQIAATVSVYPDGSTTAQATLTTDGLGNFFTTQPVASLVPAAGQQFAQGAHVVVRPTGGTSRSMLGIITNGSCNSCHSQSGGVARVTAQEVDSPFGVSIASSDGGGESSSAAASSPPTVPAIPLAQIAVGATHGCVLKADGGVVCWGSNAQGQLGNGTTEPATTSTPVLSGVTALGAAGDNTCARVGSGQGAPFYCWGTGAGLQAATPQLVDPDAGNVPAALASLLDAETSPVTLVTMPAVAGLESTTFVRVATAGNHGCGITDQNRVKCWEGTSASVDIPVL